MYWLITECVPLGDVIGVVMFEPNTGGVSKALHWNVLRLHVTCQNKTTDQPCRNPPVAYLFWRRCTPSAVLRPPLDVSISSLTIACPFFLCCPTKYKFYRPMAQMLCFLSWHSTRNFEFFDTLKVQMLKPSRNILVNEFIKFIDLRVVR